MIYDCLIIGGGPGGYRAAERAGHCKMTVALFEERSLGGVCLNEGCMPTKTLLYSAKLYDYAKGGAHKYGVDSTGATIDHKAVIERKDKIVKTLVSGVAAQMKGAKVEVIAARGVIEGKSANGFLVKANGKVYEGKHLIIASGSNAAVPPVPGLKEAVASGDALTNREILALKEAPKKLLVMGGGVIGLEMASYFNSIGSDVTVVEMLDRIGGPTDLDMTKMLQAEYEKKGIHFLLSTKVVGVKNTNVDVENASGKKTLSADKILVSVGRRANTADLNAQAINLYLERGAVVTDDQMKTNVPGVFAVGDVNGKSMLAHTAYREAEVAVHVMAGIPDRMSYRAIPAVIYTNPEVASVGETAETAAAKSLKFRVVQLPLRFAGRYIAENEGGNGFIKLILGSDDEILGCCMIGNPASEIIPAMAVAVDRRMTCKDLGHAVFPHPTVSEIFREAVLSQVK
ncbi:MAG: dihydrolipoyl dehydrogenase [Victivallaceae bacterium]|nr:dihydrolipoyl dehydrogenase [Victivallaceae bacterium]